MNYNTTQYNMEFPNFVPSVRLRDEVRDLPCNYKCRHDAAADLIHIYAYTKCFFRIRVSSVI